MNETIKEKVKVLKHLKITENDLKIIGKNQKRVDAKKKVTGKTKFINDLSFSSLCYAKVLRSPYGKAKIKKIDLTKALSFDGVLYIATGEDALKRIGIAVYDEWPIAKGEVKFYGEPVAVVVAETENIAKEALKLIEVEYQKEDPILLPQESAKQDAPLVHKDVEKIIFTNAINPELHSNISHHFKLRRGNTEAAFKEAYLVVENTYWFPSISHMQMEPHGAIAFWTSDDELEIYSSTQAPFIVRSVLSYLHDLPSSKVRVIVPQVGGGFGGKSDYTIEPMLSIAAKGVKGRPVKLVLEREEMFYGSVLGRGCFERLKTSVDKNGHLLALEAELYFRAGAYAERSIWVAQGAGHNATGPYEIENLKIDSYNVYTNTPPMGAYRGYGHPEVHWAMERQIDIIARKLKMDPAQLRKINLLGPSKKNSLGQILKPSNGDPMKCLEIVNDAISKEKKGLKKEKDKSYGFGIASFMKSAVMTTNPQSGAIIKFSDDGSVLISTGAIEMGQGLQTVMSQIASEILSIPVEKVRYIETVDTDFSPYEWQTVASHTTWAVGRAVKEASENALSQIKEAASKIFETDIDNIVVKDEKAYALNNEEDFIPLKEIVMGYKKTTGEAVNKPIVGSATFVPEGLTYPDKNTGQGNPAATWTFGSQGAIVEIDNLTGELKVLKLITAIDAGKIINPKLARGQIVGAMFQGLGPVLMEEVVFSKDGVIRNDSLTDYKVPTLEDSPEFDVYFVETLDKTGPFGARGLAEHGIVAIAPSIANAISNALGIDLFELPLTPEKILKTLYEQKK